MSDSAGQTEEGKHDPAKIYTELPLVGDRLGPFMLDKKLGEGGMGCVYLAHHLIKNEIRAIKVLPPKSLSEKFFVDTFIREANILSELTPDDALVRYYHYDRQGDLHYIVLEYVEGGSLTDRINNSGKLSVAEVRTLLIRCAQGLSVLHRNNIVHRDLKPDNIMLKSGAIERAKLVDFGIAKAEVVETVAPKGSFVGTFQYASPEQLRGAEIDGRSDIYSLGLVLLYAATGKTPRAGILRSEIPRSSEMLPDLSSVPKKLRGQLTWMLQPDRRKRPASIDELLRGTRKASAKMWATLAAGAIALLLSVVGIFEISNVNTVDTRWLHTVRPEPVAQVPPPLAPQPDLVTIAKALTDRLKHYKCANLAANVVDRKITLGGFVQSDADWTAALTEARQYSGVPVVSGVEISPWPFCAVRQLSSPPDANGRPSLQAYHPDIQHLFMNKYADARYAVNEIINFYIEPPTEDDYNILNIIFVDSEGKLDAVLVDAKSQPFDGKLRPIKSNFAENTAGKVMVVSIFSKSPLGILPKAAESLDSYLNRLRTVSESTTPKPKINSFMIDIVNEKGD